MSCYNGFSHMKPSPIHFDASQEINRETNEWIIVKNCHNATISAHLNKINPLRSPDDIRQPAYLYFYDAKPQKRYSTREQIGLFVMTTIEKKSKQLGLQLTPEIRSGAAELVPTFWAGNHNSYLHVWKAN